MENDVALYEQYSTAWSDDSIRLFSTPSSVARDSFLYVQEAGYFKTVPPYFTERKNLASYLIVHTLSGAGALTYNDHTLNISKGDTFLIDCIDYHRYCCAPDSTWEFVWLHFCGKSAAGYYREFERLNTCIVNIEDKNYIETTLMRIISLTEHKDVHSELICSKLIINILTELIVQSSGTTAVLPSMPDYIKRAKKYINENFRDNISLEDIAHVTNISKYYLSREFKKHVGETVTEYLIEQRINYSKKLLRESDIPVSEIAFLCGMNHVTHFINLFKRIEHQTPLTYRKTWK